MYSSLHSPGDERESERKRVSEWHTGCEEGSRVRGNESERGEEERVLSDAMQKKPVGVFIYRRRD